MASASIPSPRMDWSNPDRSQALREFRQVADLWFKIKKTPAEEQHTYVILWSGVEGLRMFNTWKLTDEQLTDPKNVWDAFATQLEPQENFRIHRLEFQRYRQGSSETIDDFILRCRTKAAKCKFKTDDTVEERIIEVLIAGIRHPEVQKALLSKDENLKLDEAASLARTHEASDSHMSQLNSLDRASVHDLHQSSSCRNCGLRHPPKKCPAFKSQCHKCGMKGHWKKLCKSSGDGSKHRSRSQTRQAGREKGSWKNRSKSRSRNHGKNLHPIASKNVDDDLPRDFEDISIESIYVGHVHVDGVPIDDSDDKDELFATLKFSIRDKPGNHTLRVKVDTGAQGNVLPLRCFRKAFPELLDDEGYPLESAVRLRHVRLYAYNETPIQQYGCFDFPCQYKDGKWFRNSFFIVDTRGPAILGLQSSVKMRLVIVNCEMHQRSSPGMIKSTQDLVAAYPDQFQGIGRFPGEYHITLEENAEPVVHPPRKFPIHLRDELKEELDRMESIDVIKKVSKPTDWVSSLAFSRKSNGKLRVCLDPKDLNKACKRTYHKAPTLEEITHKLHGAQVFSKLDARHGYWSVALDDESSYLTTFNSPFGRYRFKRLPFGIRVAQDIFQEKMDMILEQCPGTIGIADDIVVYGKTEAEHDKALHNLMTVGQEYGLVFNPDKCDVKLPQVKFFGCLYDKEGVHPDPSKIADITSLPTPSCLKELQQFLGMVQYMSPFIPKLAENAETLRALTRKDSVWQWTPSHQKSFEHLKSLVSSMCTLTYFDPSKPTTIQVDASTRGLGAALLQEGKPVAFASKALTDTESRYANIEREMLAVVFGCTRFHTYVYGAKFTVESDHKPLESIHRKNLANAPPRLQRMLLRLQPYDFNLVYKPGREVALADGLSRINPEKQPTMEFDKTIHGIYISPSKLKQMQDDTEANRSLKVLKDIILTGWPDDVKKVPKEVRHYWSCRDTLSVEDGLIMKGERIFIPETMQQEVLQSLHAGHQGTTKTQLKARSCVYWDGLSKTIEQMVQSCQACNELQKAQQKEPLLQHEVPNYPWETVGTDLFHFEGDEYLVIVDYWSKFPVVRKIRGSCTSSTVVRITKNIFSEQGIPLKIVSDNGPQFSSREYKSFTDQWNIQHVTSSPHYPQSNGLVERAIQTIKSTLKKVKMTGGDPDLALLCLRTTPIDSSLPSPAELLQGRKYRSNLPMKMHSDHQSEIKEKLRQRQERQKDDFDRRGVRELPPLVPDQKVTVFDHVSETCAPATVIQKCQLEPRSYMIQTPNGSVLRRNRRDLRSLENPQRKQVRFNIPQNCADRTPSLPKDYTQQNPSDDHHQSSTNGYHTRSGRLVKKPDRLIEN
ncbi:uncharacterized protein K02A2.6-like [Lytechinus pictus]|uniref:uncharacterized protein K02A2.6-like n=1 Tax=Lytechinus pictus TaxID=7653 RepID=UPI0030BA111B